MSEHKKSGRSNQNGDARRNGAPSRTSSPEERFRSLEKTTRTVHTQVDKTLKRARKAAEGG